MPTLHQSVAALPDAGEEQAELVAVLDPGVSGVAQLGRIGRPDVLGPLLLARRGGDRQGASTTWKPSPLGYCT
jgi:hypothetical protein